MQRLAIAAIIAILSSPGRGLAQSLEWTTDRTVTHRIDFGASTQDASRFGAHYDIRYELNRSRTNPAGHHFGLSFSGTGFEDVRRDEAALSVTYVESKVVGRYYRGGTEGALSPEHQLRARQLLEIDMADRSPAQEGELSAIVARGKQARFVTYDVHHRLEYARISDVTQHALGVAVATELPVLHNVLGFLSEISGTRDGFRQLPLRLYLGAEYVVSDGLIIGESEVEANYARIRAQAAWSTLVLDAFVLRATWNGDWAIERPAEVRAIRNAVNHVVQAWLIFPLREQSGLLVKYTSGKFSPEYRTFDALKLGFTVSVQ